MTARPALICISALLSLTLAGQALAINDAADDAKDAKRLAAARANVDEPVDHVRFLRPVHHYEVVGDHSLLVWETNFKAWLVEVRKSEACQANDLDKTVSIGLDSPGDTLSTQNGYVVGDFNLRCKMTSIQEVDVPGMRATERGEVAAAD